MASNFVKTPEPPYYVVIFTSRRRGADSGYDAMAAEIARILSEQPGVIGAESARGVDGFGITVGYFTDAESLLACKDNERHREAQELGKARWCEHYEVKVAKVERAYSGPL